MSLTSRSVSATVSARKAKLRLDDDSDSDTESARQKHLTAVARRKAAAPENRAVASAKPPASARSVPQLALSCVPADEIQDRSARSTQRGTAPNTGRASTFSTPRHDATSLDMRRAMMFNDSDDDDDSADRIVRAASQRLQLGSSTHMTPSARANKKSSLSMTQDISTHSLVTPAPVDVTLLPPCGGPDEMLPIVAHTTPMVPDFPSLCNTKVLAVTQQSRLEKVIGHISDDEDSPMAHKIFKKKEVVQAPEPEPVPEVYHVHEHHFEEHKLEIADSFKSQHDAIDLCHHDILMIQKEMRHQQLVNRQLVKTLEDTKRTMSEEIGALKSELRGLKSKLSDEENSIPARIKQAERSAVPWDRYRNSRAPSPNRRVAGMLGR